MKCTSKFLQPNKFSGDIKMSLYTVSKCVYVSVCNDNDDDGLAEEKVQKFNRVRLMNHKILYSVRLYYSSSLTFMHRLSTFSY